MVWDALGSPEADVTLGVADRMYAAVTEEDVFTVLNEVCETLVGVAGFEAYVLALDGRTVRRVAGAGDLSGSIDLGLVETWLMQGVDPEPAINASAAADVSLLWRRLSLGPSIVGGLIFALRVSDEADERRCSLVARLAAGALAGLRQRRLSHMVLEALEQSEEAISFYDQNDGVVFTNSAYHRIFPHYPGRIELIGTSHLELYRMDLAAGVIDDPLARADPEAYIAERGRKSQTLVASQREIQKIAGRTYIYTRSRSRTGATMSRRIDITEQALTEARLLDREKELHSLAFQDPLTGLFNRAYLRDRLQKLQHRLVEGSVAGVAVFLIDLNGFKFVNDTYGHECGDHVLATVADRLSRHLPEDCVIVRLGGDEFVVLFERELEARDLAAVADRLIALVSEPVEHREVVLRVGTSVGIAFGSGERPDIASIVGDADLAMYEAKKQRCSAFRFFHPDMREAIVERHAIAEDLRGALRSGEFEIHYQPQFSTQSGELVGFEALARWRHPERGFVSPTIFIPIMEESGQIEELGEWVLETACAEARLWPAALRLAVNVSPMQVHSTRFSSILSQTLTRTTLPPHRLELEITESIFLADEDRARAELDTWKALGVGIALDDFGRGYSSLSYLSAFPIDKIKIDRKFLEEFDPRQPDAAAGVILRALIELGRLLGMKVTAEGIERPDQLDYLRLQSCTEVQGFLLGRPMPVGQVTRLLASDTAINTGSKPSSIPSRRRLLPQSAGLV